MHQPKKSELIEGKFVNTRVLLGLFVRLCKFTLPVSFHPLEKKYFTTNFSICQRKQKHKKSNYRNQCYQKPITRLLVLPLELPDEGQTLRAFFPCKPEL